MKKDKIYIISSFTHDIIISRDSEKESLGGPAYYSGYTLEMLNADYKIITSIDGFTKDLLKRSYENLFNKIVYESSCDKSFIFIHRYENDLRRSYLLKRGCDINIKDLFFEKSSKIIISPVFNEISKELVRKIVENNFFVALDLQGFVRRLGPENLVINVFNDETKDLLRDVRIIHASNEEIKDLSKDPVEASKILMRLSEGDMIIISMGRRGSIVNIKDLGVFHVSSYRKGVDGDETGCGDIFLASIVYYLSEEKDPLEAVSLASVVAGLRVARGFPFNIDPAQINFEKRFIEIKRL